ncbi:MAG: heparinase II/III family protein [Planctomycetota bacterium]
MNRAFLVGRTIFIVLLTLFFGDVVSNATEFTFEVSSGQWKQEPITGVDPTSEAFAVELQVDPVTAIGGDVQVVSGIVIGLQSNEKSAARPVGSLRVQLREGAGRASYGLWHRNRLLSKQIPNPLPAGWAGIDSDYQQPTTLPILDGRSYVIKLVVWPKSNGSVVRLFFDDDRPAEEHQVDERITAGVIKLFSMRGGQERDLVRTSRLHVLRSASISLSDADSLPEASDSVLDALDLSQPSLKLVSEAIKNGDRSSARRLFLEHMRTRTFPRGPSLEEASDSALHPDWQLIADEAVAGRYGTLGYFSKFADSWTDTNGHTHRWVLSKQPLKLNWARCNGHLNRHFHWVSMAKAWESTGKSQYAARFSEEVIDWVSREPFFWDRCPTVGGINLMDGTVFRWGYMNTSNIGRRLELTWWPAYEVFRRSPDFSDEAHFAMLLGMLRQARLIMNPSSFAAHDDGGAHTTMALLQTALLLPEFKESKAWRETAVERWDNMLKAQFHPDGSHVSLSTGYSWASVATLENYLQLMKRSGADPPRQALRILERAYDHAMMLSTPSQSNIDLNDGGWGSIDDWFRRALKSFPDREEFRWMATKGLDGSPPEEDSVYFPNAGQYFMRTGWGSKHKFLFFGAGPWGASHGKFDALNLYAQYGNQLLIRNAGRGSYSGVGNTVHAGKSLSFNTLSPDWAQENSIPHWKQEMHLGFHPKARRWHSDLFFDYGEGSFEYGWHRPGEHIQGKWLRQVVFVKGIDELTEGYYLVVDTVVPRDRKLRTWRHPWQLGLNTVNIAIDIKSNVTTAINEHAALQILSVDPGQSTQLRIIQGQETPERLGWRIYDKIAKPWPVPTYEWTAESTFCRAWVIQLQASPSEWPVESIDVIDSNAAGSLSFTVTHRSGRVDHVQRTFPEQDKVDFEVRSIDRLGDVIAELKLTGGTESVAKFEQSLK